MIGTDMREQNDALRNRLVALTRDLILIPSVASRPDDTERGLDFIKNHLDTLEHIRIHEYRHRGIPSIVALPDGIETPDLLLCGHLDVIEHPDLRVYKSDVRDGRIYGPGAGDMKGALAILSELFRDYHARFPSASLGLAITTDEERGGESGIGYLFGETGMRCGAAIIPDGGSINEITVEEKGLLHLELRSEGHAAHAARPWLGRNALETIIEAAARVRGRFAEWANDDAEHWFPTCAATLIETANWTINRVPAYASVGLDIRFPSPFTAQTILDAIRDVVPDDVLLHVIISAEPTHLSPDDDYLKATQEITGRPARRSRTAGGSDARFMAQCDIPVMMSRPIVGELHSDAEWIDIDSMVTFYRVCERYLEMRLNHS